MRSRRRLSVLAAWLALAPAVGGGAEQPDEAFASLVGRDTPPPVFDLTPRSDTLVELYLEGPPYRGEPTRVFALFGSPAETPGSDGLEAGSAPGIVLVHGGGGTAYEEWVRRWNEAGFAAISVAVEGQTDTPDPHGVAERWARHPFGGPWRNGIYGDFAEPLADEWMFHAVHAAIQAHNFLRHRPEVDSRYVGIAGISWGAVITITAVGFDHRFAFAIPVYGSGRLQSLRNQYGAALAENPEFADVWEPTLRLRAYAGPALWLTGLDERHFTLDAQAATYAFAAGDAAISIKPGMRHNHRAGWEQPEPYAFAAGVVRSGAPPFVAVKTGPNAANLPGATFRLDDGLTPVGATVFSTADRTIGPDTRWIERPAVVVAGHGEGLLEATGREPVKDAAWWFVNLTLQDRRTGQSLTASSRLYSQPVH